jgi:copper chaperone
MSAVLKTITLSTPDMGCGHCVATIEEALGSLQGVSSTTADLETKTVSVEIDPARASEQQVRETLDTAGYPAS